eukprot:jgi/Mesvir1/16587/Mv10122-RA.1
MVQTGVVDAHPADILSDIFGLFNPAPGTMVEDDLKFKLSECMDTAYHCQNVEEVYERLNKRMAAAVSRMLAVVGRMEELQEFSMMEVMYGASARIFTMREGVCSIMETRVPPKVREQLVKMMESMDCVTFHAMTAKWSYDTLANKIGGKPELYDIFKPVSVKTPVSVGVYFANPDKGKNQLASKVLSRPINGDVLLVKTFDDGENPTEVRTITPDEFSLAVHLPCDVWVECFCQDSSKQYMVMCRGCGKPYYSSTRLPSEDLCKC